MATAPATPVPATQPNAVQPNNPLAPTSAEVANQPSVSPADVRSPASKPESSQTRPAGGAAITTAPLAVAVSKPAANTTVLFDQRLSAGKLLLEQKKAVASIQLFYNEEINPERTEGFLKRADKLGVLHEIYLLPAKFGNKNGLRVLYGAYPSVDAAHEAIKDLPARYQQAFATSTYIF
jgi:septal ring-binding cell division protein DamX